MDKNLRGQNKKEVFKLLSLLTHLGYIMVTPIILGILGGNWLDGYFSTTPLLMILGVVLGVGASFRNLFIYFEKFNK